MTDTVLKTRARWWTAAFLVATFGSAALVAAGVLHGWFGRGLFVASFLLLWPMTRAVNEAQAACGAGSPASRAYGRRMLVASFAYILLFLGQSLTKGRQIPPWFGAWLPDIVLGILGLLLFKWRNRVADGVASLARRNQVAGER